MAERYLTAQEVADLLKIKKNTVYDMIKKGSLRAVKVGKQFRVAESEVRAVLGQAAPAVPAVQPSASGERFIVCGQDALLDLLCDSANQALGEPFFFRSYMGSYNGLHAMYQGQVDA
ncbi:MAG: helix-turn-helix domain-containing protein, partial [Butyricicoccus sp.]